MLGYTYIVCLSTATPTVLLLFMRIEAVKLWLHKSRFSSFNGAEWSFYIPLVRWKGKKTSANQSRNSPRFTETEVSVRCSEKVATFPYTEPEESHPLHSYFLKIDFNIILPPKLTSS